MKQAVRQYLILLIVLSLAAWCARTPVPDAGTSSPRVTTQSSSGTGGLIYVNPYNTTNQIAGTNFTISIQVANVSEFNGWDVYVESSNPSVIVPISASFAGDLFETNSTQPATPTEAVECINGQVLFGTACGPGVTGPGVIEFGAAVIGPTVPAPVFGLLFNVTFGVVSSNGGSLIQIPSATLTTGGISGLNPLTSLGIYGKLTPDFIVSVNPGALTVVQDSNITATIFLVSIFKFSGNMTLRVSGVLGFTISQPSLKLSSQGTASATVTFFPGAIQALFYPETITASNGTSSSRLSHAASTTVTVVPPSYFVMGLSSARLQIHAGNSANTTILLNSYGFDGTVRLRIQAPENMGVTYALASQNVTLGSGPIAVIANVFTDALEISTPITSLPYLYLINITATYTTHGSSTISPPIQLKVVPPAASLLVQPVPTSLTIRAGSQGHMTISVSSVDYFWGFLYASATMVGGDVAFNSTQYYLALPNSAHVSYTPSLNIGITVNVTSDTPPGYYIVRLTVYSLSTAYQPAFSTQIAVPVIIDPPILHAADKVLGLPSIDYFGILGALAIPLVLLSIQTYRRREKETDDWRK